MEDFDRPNAISHKWITQALGLLIGVAFLVSALAGEGVLVGLIGFAMAGLNAGVLGVNLLDRRVANSDPTAELN